MAQIKVFGYCDQLTVKAGDTLSVKASVDGADSVTAQLVRLIHGDAHPDGPGFVEETIDSPINHDWPAKKQYTQVGSFLRVHDPDDRLAAVGSFTLHAFINSTLPDIGVRQALLGRWSIDRNEGYCLGINQKGYLEFWVGDGQAVDYVAAEVPLVARVWYFIAVSYDASTGRATIHQQSVLNRYNSLLSPVAPMDYGSHVHETLRVKPFSADAPFLVAGAQDWHELRGHFVAQCFCGKIDRHGMYDRALTRDELEALAAGGAPHANGLLAYWDTTHGYTDRGIGDTVFDTGPYHLHAEGYNRPIRAQTGWNWNGRDDSFRLAPQQYGGIEFHVDAMIDSNWDETLSFTIPASLRSGVYAVRLRVGDGAGLSEDHVVFFLRAAVPKAPVALLMPTASYLAYANEKLSFDAQIIQPMAGQPPIVSEVDIEMYKNHEFGLSTYDHFLDGLGVSYSSYRRPVVNMRPKYRMSSMGLTWQFPADLSIVAWLEKLGYDYEILTDEDLHRDGLAALKPYKVVLSGSHPEYYSERMLDATEDYVSGGGRLLYMGGNGYYWCVGFREDEPWIMEVRKLDSGSRAWEARPGEHYLCTTGEKSGLWKNRGRPPQKLTGVGFTAEGFEESKSYRRMPDSYHRTVSWIMEGVEGDIIGDFGLARGGAAGVELDRYDLALGTPPHTRILASSGGHSDNYMLVVEEIVYMHPGFGGTQEPKVRADMTWFTAPNHGAVFCTGSIAWSSALPSNDFDNNVSRITKNVVDACLKDGPLPGWAWIADEKQWR
jgi:N,N-dimethylformamidase